jgi:hypothetical protein
MIVVGREGQIRDPDCLLHHKSLSWWLLPPSGDVKMVIVDAGDRVRVVIGIPTGTTVITFALPPELPHHRHNLTTDDSSSAHHREQ